jgi:hypothetical protein
VFIFLCLTTGLALILINLYGLTQPIRKPGLGVTNHQELRFVPKHVQSYNESLDRIEKLAEIDSNRQRSEDANIIINNSLTHVDWTRVDPSEYRHLIPIWENYFLWGLGRFSNLPQLERYHYSDYKRSIRRGIGICGDASVALSSVMDRYNIPNHIVSFDGHVIVEYQDEKGDSYLLDPDFGVSLSTSLENLNANILSVRKLYLSAGYSEKEIYYLFEAYNRSYSIYDDTYHFMTLRYIFEKASYVAKWVLPTILIFLSIVLGIGKIKAAGRKHL